MKELVYTLSRNRLEAILDERGYVAPGSSPEIGKQFIVSKESFENLLALCITAMAVHVNDDLGKSGTCEIDGKYYHVPKFRWFNAIAYGLVEAYTLSPGAEHWMIPIIWAFRQYGSTNMVTSKEWVIAGADELN